MREIVVLGMLIASEKQSKATVEDTPMRYKSGHAVHAQRVARGLF